MPLKSCVHDTARMRAVTDGRRVAADAEEALDEVGARGETRGDHHVVIGNLVRTGDVLEGHDVVPNLRAAGAEGDMDVRVQLELLAQRLAIHRVRIGGKRVATLDHGDVSALLGKFEEADISINM